MENYNKQGSLYLPVKIGRLNVSAFIDKTMHAVDSGRLSSPHCHYMYELRYVESGECRLSVDGETFDVSSHKVILVRPNEYHFQPLDGVSPHGSQYTLRFTLKKPTAEAKPEFKRAYDETLSVLSKVRVVKDAKHSLSFLFKRIEAELGEGSVGSVSCLCTLASLVITDFFRACAPEGLTSVFSIDDMRYNGATVKSLETFFSDHYRENIKIADLARVMCLSERQTSRIINMKYGVSFSKKLSEVRLARAAYMLLHTNDKAEKISAECGFKNSSYFFKTFKEKYGLTPAEYRKKHKISK